MSFPGCICICIR